MPHDHSAHDHHGHDHGHSHAGHNHAGHTHDHTKNANARQLGWALALTAGFLIVEVVAGFAFKSLALLSDAAHMFTDTMALAIALMAIRIGQKPADHKRTFGYRRLEILAAAFNAALLFFVAFYILYEAVMRLVRPEPVQPIGMLVVAGLGLVINLIAMRILSGGKDHSLNVKGAYLEVWADAVGSVGVIVGALLIRFTGWGWVDPVVAVLIGVWVLPRTWALLRQSSHILLEGVPDGVVLEDVRNTLMAVPGVAGVHDLHVWVSGADRPSMSAHIELRENADAEGVRIAAARQLEAHHGLSHVTLQTEFAPCEDKGALHA